jgi:hypothetical protein
VRSKNLPLRISQSGNSSRISPKLSRRISWRRSSTAWGDGRVMSPKTVKFRSRAFCQRLGKKWTRGVRRCGSKKKGAGVYTHSPLHILRISRANLAWFSYVCRCSMTELEKPRRRRCRGRECS